MKLWMLFLACLVCIQQTCHALTLPRNLDVLSVPLLEASSHTEEVTDTTDVARTSSSGSVLAGKAAASATTSPHVPISASTTSKSTLVVHHSTPLHSYQPSTTTQRTFPTHIPQSSTHHPTIETAGAIAGEVIGGLVLLVLFWFLGRCLWSWKRTPKPDRIAAIHDRAYLDREMSALAQAPLRTHMERARCPSPPPPPPYVEGQARLPTYENTLDGRNHNG